MLALGKWPEINKKLINEKAEKEIEAIDKVISDVRHIQKIVDTKKSSNFSSFENQQIFNKQSSKVILYVIPFELENYKAVLKEIEKELSINLVTDISSSSPDFISLSFTFPKLSSFSPTKSA